jgi:hypothetical protein
MRVFMPINETQFASQRSFPVHAEFGADHEWHSTGIDFSDYSRMQTSARAVAPGRQLETPSWAVSDTQLREVLVAFLEERAFHSRAGLQTGTLAERLANAQKKIIADCQKLIATIDSLCARLVLLKRSTPLTQEICTRIRNLEIQIEALDTRLRFEQRDGGASLVTGIVFFYYRVGFCSVGTAKQLSIKPPQVRQTLWRLRNTWAKLELWAQNPSKRPVPKPPKPKRIPQRPPVDVERGALLLAQRHTFTDAAMLLGVSRGRLRVALAKAGLYQPRFQKKKVVGTKEVINRLQTTKERYVAIVERLATANDGRIPTCGWLRAHGYSLTYVFLRRHPDWFTHLPRERAKTGPGRHINTFNAERAVRLYRTGMSVTKIALMFGYPPQHGNNRVRRALIVAGIYPAANKKSGHGGPADSCEIARP